MEASGGEGSPLNSSAGRDKAESANDDHFVSYWSLTVRGKLPPPNALFPLIKHPQYIVRPTLAKTKTLAATAKLLSLAKMVRPSSNLQLISY